MKRSTLKINHQHIWQVESWCLKNIGPRLFYIHNKRGGQGWMITRIPNGSWLFELENEKMMTMAILTIGSYLND